MTVINVYVVYFSDWSVSILSLILSTCTKRKQGNCETHGQNNSSNHFSSIPSKNLHSNSAGLTWPFSSTPEVCRHNRNLHKFIIITIIVLSKHVSRSRHRAGHPACRQR